MTFGLSAAAVAGLAIGGAGIGSAIIGGNAAQNAAQIQANAAQSGINAQTAEFNKIQQLLSPFVTTGQSANAQAGNLSGANGNDAQAAALKTIQSGPVFTGLNALGQDAILQNASATGGLRGGNVQAALAQFSPALLNQLIRQQFGQLSGLSTTGANAGAGLGTLGQQNTNAVSGLLTQQGAALAGGQLGSAQAFNQGLNSIVAGLGLYKGLGGTF
jgi:hypothetical protein